MGKVNLDIEAHIPLKDGSAVAAADVVCDLRREAFVMHKKKVEFPDVADQELLQAIGQKVSRLHQDHELDVCSGVTLYVPSCCSHIRSSTDIRSS